jgi:hypothetical protein
LNFNSAWITVLGLIVWVVVFTATGWLVAKSCSLRAADSWRRLPPPEHPHHEAFRMLALKYDFGEYAEQKSLLEKRQEQISEDVFVASFKAVEREEKVSSYCVWSKGVPTWLPKTEFIGLYDPDTKQTGFVPWDRLQATVGHMMKPLDCYPPRWFVNEFPSPEQVEQLNALDWSE